MRFLLALAFAGAFAFQAQAQVGQGTGLACDTREQVEQFAESMNAGNAAPDSIAQVNAKHTSSNACGIVHIAWNDEAVLATVSINNNIYEIISFNVIGIQQGNGWIPVRPMLQFGLKRTIGRGA